MWILFMFLVIDFIIKLIIAATNTAKSWRLLCATIARTGLRAILI